MKKVARQFLKAAELIDSGQIMMGCCYALGVAEFGGTIKEYNMQPALGYDSFLHNKFREVFDWVHDGQELREHWGRTCIESPDGKDARVIALCFCAAMMEAGDL